MNPTFTEERALPHLDAAISPFHGGDLVVFSHLRWDFVFQRPQHLLTRFARHRRTYFVEEPVFTGMEKMEILERENGVKVVLPHLPEGLSEMATEQSLAKLIDQLIDAQGIQDFTAWYYTPMALAFTRHLDPLAVIYDCMDELSAFKGSHPKMLERESQLLNRANIVFTGGVSLFEAKKKLHPNIHPFPSSIDTDHFRRARQIKADPADQARIPGPRIGFFGVLDERFDSDLIEAAARRRPDWHFVMIGPIAKISREDLPHLPNIHYLGKKTTRSFPLTFPAGTWRSCRSPETNPRASSAPRKPRNTWRPESRWYPPRSAT